MRLFAGYREKVGQASLELELEQGSTVGLLASEMADRYPTLIGDSSKLVVAVNEEYQDHGHILSERDEVALIPPVSGGTQEAMIEITHDVLDPEAVTAKVRKDSNGAVVTFLGSTRDHNSGRKVLHLEYEAYRPMADNQLGRIADEIRQRWAVDDVAISHRLGRLEIGELSLVVSVASPHRKEAFEACQYSIDRIKQAVPIWKKEFFEGGDVWVGSQEDIPVTEAAFTDRP